MFVLKQKLTMENKSSHQPAISIAMAVHRCNMKHIAQCGSHWTLPPGHYSLCIAPAAARAAINKTAMQNTPTLLAILMAIAMRRYNDTEHIDQ